MSSREIPILIFVGIFLVFILCRTIKLNRDIDSAIEYLSHMRDLAKTKIDIANKTNRVLSALVARTEEDHDIESLKNMTSAYIKQYNEANEAIQHFRSASREGIKAINARIRFYNIFQRNNNFPSWFICKRQDRFDAVNFIPVSLTDATVVLTKAQALTYSLSSMNKEMNLSGDSVLKLVSA